MSAQFPHFPALMACRKQAGSDSALARALGVSQPTAWRWLNTTKALPPEYVLTAERIYGVSRHDLRSDIYPRENEPRFLGVDQQACRVSFQKPRISKADAA